VNPSMNSREPGRKFPHKTPQRNHSHLVSGKKKGTYYFQYFESGKASRRGQTNFEEGDG